MAGPAAPADGEATPWERLIYIPYKNLEGVFDKQDGTVLVPYLEYLRLWEASGGGTRPTIDAAPVNALITEAHYVGRVEQDVVRIAAEYQVRVLDKPWAQVPLHFGDAAVGSLDGNDSGALLRGTGDGTYALLLPKAGTHTVKLELVTPIHTSPEGRSFELACPPVGITTFELIIPQPDQTVKLTPHLVSLPSETAQGETRIKAGLGSTSKLSAQWHPRAGIKPEMDLLTSVTNRMHVMIDEGLVHTDAVLDYAVLRGELAQIQIAVPLGHRILDVAASNARLKSWTAANEDNRQLVTVELLSGISDRIAVEVHTEAPLPDEPFDVAGLEENGSAHGIHTVGAVRESGQLAISHGTSVSLAVESQQGTTRIDAGDAAQPLQQSDAVYYRFYNPRFTLRVSARRVEPRIVVFQRASVILDADQVRLASELNAKIDRAGVFELRLHLPEGYTVDSVGAPNKKEHVFDASSRVLTVTFNEAQQNDITVTVNAHRELTAEQFAAPIKLPLLEPAGVEQESGRIFVYAPDAIEAVTDDASLVGVQPDPGEDAPDRGGMRLTSAWTYNRRPVEVTVTTARRPTHLTAEVGTTLNVHEEVIEVHTLLTYAVEHAGVGTFRFSVPEDLADNIQITLAEEGGGKAIKQRTRASEAVDGWVTWTVVMQQDVLDEIAFRIRYDLQPGAAADAIVIEPLRVLGLEGGDGQQSVALSRIVGEVAVEKDRALFVTAEAEGGDIEAVDVRELEVLSSEGDLAFRYHKQPVELRLRRAKHKIQEVVETVVSRGVVEIVIGRDDRAAYRGRYRIKSSQRQRLAIHLPAGAEPLGVLVDRKLVALEKGETAQTDPAWDAYYVNVARSKRSDEPFSLTVQFLTPLGQAPFRSGGGRLYFRLPQIGSGDGAAAVQEQRVAVWIPDEFSLVGTPDRFVRRTEPHLEGLVLTRMTGDRDTRELDAWIGDDAAGMLDFPTQGHAYRYQSLGSAGELSLTWWRMSFFTWIISGLLVVVALILTRTSWENRLGILLLAAFVIALGALEYPDEALHILVAARYGIVVLVALWLIHALFRRRPVATGYAPAAGGPMVTPGGAVVIPPPGIFRQQTSQFPPDEPDKK